MKRSLLLVALVAACGSEEAAPTSPTPADGNSATTPPPSDAPPSSATPAPSSSSPDPGNAACSGKAALSGDVDWTIQSGGLSRTVHVHVPATYDATKHTPVVLDFHGYTSNGLEQAQYTGMIRKSDEAGFIAVHAEGIGGDRQQSWNAGACCGQAADDKVDDIAFVRKILDELDAKTCVDDNRIFATGMSNGGFLSHRLACELADRIAAVAPVAGVLGVPTCLPSRPISVMHFHGTLDPLVPYDGINDGERDFPSVPDTSKGWATRNACTDTPKKTVDLDDVTCMTQSQCAGGVEVTLCTIQGGGHTWPGAIPLPGGYTTQSIRATDAMWEFFKKHPKP